MFIDFTGFAGDCLINGKLDLRAPRLTDQLNADPLVHLVDVELEDLENARRSQRARLHDRAQPAVCRPGHRAARFAGAADRDGAPTGCGPRSARTRSSAGSTSRPASTP